MLSKFKARCLGAISGQTVYARLRPQLRLGNGFRLSKTEGEEEAEVRLLAFMCAASFSAEFEFEFELDVARPAALLKSRQFLKSHSLWSSFGSKNFLLLWHTNAKSKANCKLQTANCCSYCTAPPHAIATATVNLREPETLG